MQFLLQVLPASRYIHLNRLNCTACPGLLKIYIFKLEKNTWYLLFNLALSYCLDASLSHIDSFTISNCICFSLPHFVTAFLWCILQEILWCKKKPWHSRTWWRMHSAALYRDKYLILSIECYTVWFVKKIKNSCCTMMC